MPIVCYVHVDGSMTGEAHNFAAVPRIGETVAVKISGDEFDSLPVTSVEHVPKGHYPDEPEAAVHIYVGIRN